MQDFGRTNRTNQAVAPEYVLLSLKVGGEKRFFSTIARRLEQLGALAATHKPFPGLDSGPRALAAMGLCELDTAGQGVVYPDVPRFLNRVLSLDVDRQNVVFAAFVDRMERAIERAKDSGLFEDGVADIKADAIRMTADPKVVRENDQAGGAKTVYCKLEADYPTHPFSWERAAAQLAEEGNLMVRNRRSGHYAIAKRLEGGQTNAAGRVQDRYRLFTPLGRGNAAASDDLFSRYELVTGRPKAAGETWWKERLTQLGTHHTEPLHIIGGSILPVWDVLKSARAQGARIVRVKTEDGRRVIGVEIPQQSIGEVLKGLGVGMENVTPESVYKAVHEQRETVTLAGGLTIRPALVAGEARIEIAGAQYEHQAELRRLGAFEEQLNYRKRYFIPVNEADALPVIEKVLKRYPPTGTATGGNLRAGLVGLSLGLGGTLAALTGGMVMGMDIPEGGQEMGPHGPVFREFWHDAAGAIEQLLALRTGEAIGALWHPEVGDIDLVWGEAGATSARVTVWQKSSSTTRR